MRQRLARPGYEPRPLPVTMPFRRPLAFATPKAACALPPTTAAAAAIFSYAASSNLFIGGSRKNTATPGTARLDARGTVFLLRCSDSQDHHDWSAVQYKRVTHSIGGTMRQLANHMSVQKYVLRRRDQ